MSYILEALKRSETERQRQDSPVFADVPAQRHRRSMPAWLWLLISLLLINAIILSAVLLRGDSDTPNHIVAAPVARPDVPPPVPATTPVQRDEPVVATDPAARGSRSSAPPVRTPVRSVTPTVSAPVQPAARNVSSQSNFAQKSSLPTLLELSADGTLQLPELHVDVHVYSRTPEDRFVFVNMSKYREAARLTEGPMIKEIVPEGVILEYRDSTFLLPRE